MKSSNEITPLNIVLVEPEIPQNTGNVGRTCVGLGATLHLVGQLGFSLEESALKRAGLDYWPKLKLKVHKDWETFLKTVAPAEAGAPSLDKCLDSRLRGNDGFHFFSTKGKKPLWDIKISAPAYLVFGKESSGFPPKFYSEYEDKLVRIPVLDTIRSLNLATAVGVAAFEAARQLELTLC